MRSIHQDFKVHFTYNIHFTEGLFSLQNPLLVDTLKQSESPGPYKVLFVVDSGVADTHPQLLQDIAAYTTHYADAIRSLAEPVIITGGEECKNNTAYLNKLLQAVNNYGVCRHSYLIAIGGGALLDLAGFAAAIAHRGIRHIRIPTTVLSQNDSGVGVKNSINSFDKKNFLGTFAPPFAVLNDSHFLLTLDDRDWRAGISEAVKVALIKDEAFYQEIKNNAGRLAKRDMAAMQDLIFRCAEMHVEHIGGGDPFEMGSSRPLDFGHWAAHKLEQLTNYKVRHGEAVAIGIALDVTYSKLIGMLSEQECEDVLQVLTDLGFDLFIPELADGLNSADNRLSILKGLTEFREHLGGQLTIMLLSKIGKGVEVHQIEEELVTHAVQQLKQRQYAKSLSGIH
ncbi:3-dehydroquinate synthase [Pontibacter sp. SGAir0037]|uniref:3-dehydroquinate synthase n=1 Tax=Pontibacter sp. SGAir0037 TaxID=2571030 RepID=UPI0010CD27BD|nr:3-dehydroquinate synthase [Pontibacter sp. SGAir0037]QCR21521.1 3-dehydroquinate synthase [Pontibacter sp. SGAir0037]